MGAESAPTGGLAHPYLVCFFGGWADRPLASAGLGNAHDYITTSFSVAQLDTQPLGPNG
jgi:hypothetical protein